jgi:hypothetical protein
VQGLSHRRVVVARFHPRDVVAPVLRAHRSGRVEYHAGGHGRLAHGVADVEALDPRRRLVEAEQLLQVRHPRLLAGMAGHLRCQRLLRVAPGQVQVAGALAAHAAAHTDLASRGFRKGVLHELALGNVAIEHDLGRRRLAAVVLRNEAGEDLVGLRATGLREIGAGAQVAAVAEGQQRHAGHAALRRDRQHVQVGGATIDVLARLQLADRGQQVAQARGFLEVQARAGGLHLASELVGELVAAPLQEQGCPAHVMGVCARRHQAHAGRAAAPDLVLQAGPRTIAEHAVLAAAQAEQLVHQVERLAHRPRARIRPEQPTRLHARAAMEREPRPCLVGQQDVRKALVVAQQHVVARPVRLDQLVLQQQRLGFGAGDRDLDARHLRQHRADPG